MINLKGRETKIIKYFAVNGIITLLNFVLYVVFIELFQMWYIFANIFAYIICVIISFFLNRAIVFKRKTKIAEVLEFFTMKFVMGSLSTLVLWIIVVFGKINEYIGAVVVTGSFFLMSYLASKMIFMYQYKVIDIFKLLRVKHWIKNILIFLPALCAVKFTEDIIYLNICIVSFASMCFWASVVYIINDIYDYEKDLSNPRKQQQPIVSGRITKKQAIYYLTVCVFISVCCLLLLLLLLEIKIWLGLLVWMIMYLLLNIGYSVLKMKDIPVIELFILVMGYIIRLEIGGVITGTPISNYLLLTVIGLSLYMVAEKRLAEKKLDIQKRECIKKYSELWLEKVVNFGAIFSMVFFSLWALENFEEKYTIFLIIGALIIYLFYSFDADKFSEGDPVTIIYKDKRLLVMASIYFLLIIVLFIYVR